MSDATKIEWADSTFNPWEGCTKVGPGCDHCYAESRNARFAGGQAINWGPGAPRRRTTPANWRKPLQWEREAEAFAAEHGRRRRVFCASLADVFDNEVDPSWRADLFALIRATPGLDWLLLTKRIGNAQFMIEQALIAQGDGATDAVGSWPWANVWLGATIVNQAEADRDIPKLLTTPASVRFLSMEPLLGSVDLANIEARVGAGVDVFSALSYDGESDDDVEFCTATLDWVIVGGESGPGARPIHPDWARSLRDQCGAAGVPILFKQWGEWLPAKEGRSITGKVLLLEGSAPFTSHPEWHGFEGGQQSARVGKKAAGRLLDGIEHNGFPRTAA